jgi:hypothetical protein
MKFIWNFCQQFAVAGIFLSFTITAIGSSTAGANKDVQANSLSSRQFLSYNLGFAKYFGGSGSDKIMDIALDLEGNVYVVGFSTSRDLPTTTTAYQTAYGGGPSDAFVAKFSGDGASLIWCTYLGGSNRDSGTAIALDPKGNIYLTGMTNSADFPISSKSYDNTIGSKPNIKHNQRSDIFLTKLSPNGSQLLYSTYLGGSGDDWAMDIAVHQSTGCSYVTGGTYSPDFPTTVSAYDRNYSKTVIDALLARAKPDAFVAKLSADGSHLLYSTYLGGSEYDVGEAIAVDHFGIASVAGPTASWNFPTTSKAFQQKLSGRTDVWVVKILPDGSNLLFSTLFGGSDNDGIEHSAIKADSGGSLYITGFTHSVDLPTTTTAYRRTLSGSLDNFVARFSHDGRDLLFSTFFGGSDGWETPFGTPGVDRDGNIYVGGASACTDFPVTVGALQSTLRGGNDTFLCKFSKDGSKLLYATYFGGSAHDLSRGIALDSSGKIHVIMQTSSTDILIKPQAGQILDQRNDNGFIVQFEPLRSSSP